MENHHKSRNAYKSATLALKKVFPILPLLLLVLILSGFLHIASAATAGSFSVFLPLVLNLQPTETNTPTPTATNTPAIGFGAATGRILWGDQPIAGVTVKLCTSWSIIGGCHTQVYSAVSGNDGRYTITNMPAGIYDFATKLSGQVETGWLTLHVTVVAGQTVTIRDVNIVKYDLTLISPIDHATLTTTMPTLTWAAYPGATYYKVYVVNNNTYETVVSFVKVTTTQYIFVVPLTAGEYYWDIDAYNANGTKLAESNTYFHFVIAP